MSLWPRSTVAMFPQVKDGCRAGAADDGGRATARRDVVAELIEESAGLRSCAVIDADGEVLAATDDA